MFEFVVILSIASMGSLVRWSTSVILHHFAPKSQSDTIAAGPDRGFAAQTAPAVDPVLRFGFILALDGAIVLALMSALPGDLALERTAFAFALLCAGGLIGEIAGSGAGRQTASVDADEEAPLQRGGTSRLLSAALTVMLNLSLAVLCSGQGLIEIVPPKSMDSATYTEELEPVIVVAKRTHDPLSEDVAR
jgi:hypothetical protein